MTRLSRFYNLLSKYKYFIVIALCIVIVGFADDNSVYHRAQLEMEVSDLKTEIESYNRTYIHDQRQLKALARNPRNIEKIARERYFMKAYDEDIFVLSTDRRNTDENE